MNKKVQVLRGFAVVAVVMIHTYGGGIQGVLIRPFINYAVGMFLFLSGYLTREERMHDVLSFFRRRIVKVMIPYTLWSVIYTVAFGNYRLFFKNLLTFSSHFSYYFIFVYIQMVLLTPLAFKLLNSRWKYAGLLITPVSILILRYAATFFGWSMRFPWTSAFGGQWFLFYYVGLGLRNGYFSCDLPGKKLLAYYAIALLVSIGEGFFWFFYGNYDLATTQLRMTSLLASLAAYLCAFCYLKGGETKDSLLTVCMEKLGDCSFGIYLVHGLVIYYLTDIPVYNRLFFPVNTCVVLLISTVLVVVMQKAVGKRFAAYLGMSA